LLSAIENNKSAFKIEIDDLEIEHIMPQNLTKDWQQKLGENHEEVHKKYLHTLGNLTLTTSRQNKILSNLLKEEKDKIDFQTSKLKLNFKLEENKIWNDKTIVARAKILALEAKQIWQFPQTNYKKIAIEDEIFDLTSEDDFTGRRPSFISFGNNELEEDIKSWPIFLVKLCSFLYKNSPTLFEKAMVSNGLKDYFHKDAERTFKEFDENKFVLTYLLTKTVILFAKKLCKAVNYDLENVKFKLNKQKNETNI
jgi:hypothetical protein